MPNQNISGTTARTYLASLRLKEYAPNIQELTPRSVERKTAVLTQFAHAETKAVEAIAPALTKEDASPPDQAAADQLDPCWHHKQVETQAAWQLGADGHVVTIGFVDSGINPDHPQLSSVLRTRGGENHYAYYDILDQKPEVRDTYGHGSSVVSAALGRSKNPICTPPVLK